MMGLAAGPAAACSLAPDSFSETELSSSPSGGQKSVSVGRITSVVLFSLNARGFVQGLANAVWSQPELLVEFSTSRPL